MTQTAADSLQDELVRRHHRAAVNAVVGMLALTLLQVALAFAGLVPAPPPFIADPMLAAALRITIVLFGLGAVALRRTKFSAMRLQDIAALQGADGLLATLRSTTILVALVGGAITLMGFVITMLTRNEYDMLYTGLAAAAVLLYCYPRRAAWQRVLQISQQAGEIQGSSAKGTIA